MVFETLSATVVKGLAARLDPPLETVRGPAFTLGAYNTRGTLVN